MYELVVFVHVASVLAFMLAHGVHVVAMFAFRGEPDPERALTFFNDLPNPTGIRTLLVVVVVTGVLAGFMGSWWTGGWIWTSFAVLVLIWVAMWRYAGHYYGLVQEAAEEVIAARSTDSANPGLQAAYDAARQGWQPIGMSAVGLGGLAVILWLMMFKPF
jgi:hypothetical protein